MTKSWGSKVLSQGHPGALSTLSTPGLGVELETTEFSLFQFQESGHRKETSPERAAIVWGLRKCLHELMEVKGGKPVQKIQPLVLPITPTCLPRVASVCCVMGAHQ